MKIEITCHKCEEPLLFNKVTSCKRYTLIKEIVNSGEVIEYTCPNGHVSKNIIRTFQYDILFRIACEAINDGYYREAVSSFSACLEMFFSHVVKMLLKSNGISPTLITSFSDKNKLSERIFGAFSSLWLLCEGEEYTKISKNQISKRVKFRNDVIHNGNIPTKEEAIDYSNYVVSIISPINEKIKDKYSKVLKEIYFEKKIVPVGREKIISMGLLSPLEMILDESKKVEEILPLLKKYNILMEFDSKEVEKSYPSILSTER